MLRRDVLDVEEEEGAAKARPRTVGRARSNDATRAQEQISRHEAV